MNILNIWKNFKFSWRKNPLNSSNGKGLIKGLFVAAYPAQRSSIHYSKTTEPYKRSNHISPHNSTTIHLQLRKWKVSKLNLNPTRIWQLGFWVDGNIELLKLVSLSFGAHVE